MLDLIDARVYTSDLQHTKPHPEAFLAVLGQLGVAPAAAVFVGDRPVDDISGAKGDRHACRAGRRAPTSPVTPSTRRPD